MDQQIQCTVTYTHSHATQMLK